VLLLLDNYDSFTFNLFQYLSELGAQVRVFRNDEITIEAVRRLEPEGIVLSPGPGRPENAGIMNDLIRAMAGKVPMLGVCLGHQAMAQVYGGVVGYAPTLMHGKTSQIYHSGSPLFGGVPSPFTATRYHSLVVESETLPARFKRIAWTSDEVLMGIEDAPNRLWGVQFHPESILTIDGKTMLGNFLEMCR
jgi:anthranilate synthase component II